MSPQLFAALGTRPLVGRLLGPGDAGAEAAPVALLSERLWRRAFNGDPRVLGRALVIGERAFAIVGVTPESFSGLRVMDVGERESDYPQVWLPLRDAQLWPATARPNRPWLSLAGRLSPPSTLKSARAELDLAARRIATGAPSRDSPDRRRSSFRSYRAGLDWRDEPSQSLLTMALFLFIPLSVLGIGCVNVINLQLARGMDEAGELSLRLALGASRADPAAAGARSRGLAAICGGSVCWVPILLTRAAAYFPAPPAIDGSVLAFTIVLVVGVVCVAGVRRDGDLSKRAFVMRNGRSTSPTGGSRHECRQTGRRGPREGHRAFPGRGNTGDFRVERTSGGYHVVPVAMKGKSGVMEPDASPLDTSITAPRREERAFETMTAPVAGNHRPLGRYGGEG